MRASFALALLLLSAPQSLTDADKQAAELHSTKTALLQCQVQLATATLTDEQNRLESRFRAILKPSADAVWNWQSLAFDEPKR